MLAVNLAYCVYHAWAGITYLVCANRGSMEPVGT